MSFWVQLKLIVWKNFLLRRRQKLRCLVELIWPLFLFLILMWVRTRGLRTNVHECYFTEKAMPSTGPFPFLQSFLCTFNNTCHRYINDSKVQTGPKNFTLMELIRELQAIFRDDSTDIKNSTVLKPPDRTNLRNSRPKRYLEGDRLLKVKDLVIDPDELYESLSSNYLNISKTVFTSLIDAELRIGDINKTEFMFEFIRNPKEFVCRTLSTKKILIMEDYIFEELCKLTTEDILILISEFRNQLNYTNEPKKVVTDNAKQNLQNSSLPLDDWQILNNTSDILESTLQGLQSYADFLNNITLTEIQYSTATRGMNMTKVEKAVKLIQYFLCGNQSSDLIKQIFGDGGRPSRFDSLQEQFKEKTRVKYTYDNDTTPECNEIFSEIEEIPPLRAFWRIVKPFIRGKILFTPVTPAIKRVMESVNRTFTPLLNIRELSRVWPASTLNFGKEIVKNNRNIIQFVKNYGEDFLNGTAQNERYKEQLEDLLKIIDWFSGERDKSFGLLRILQMNFSNVMECIEFNKIQGYDNRTTAEEQGMKLLVQNKLWALVEFEDPGWNELSPLTTYKIRMNTERVDNTESIMDSLSRPGARIRPAIDLKYLTYGFAYLQDMIDHSIIREQSKQETLPGIILQQFPYPCYIDDQFVMAISRTFPLFMVLSWVYTCSMIVKSIVYEKEERLKETMRVMGLGNGIHWLGWFIDSLIPMIFTIFLLTIILVYGNVLMRADATVVFVFLLSYCLATIGQSFLISVFFSRANLAAACAGIIFFVLYLPYPFMVRWMLYLSSTEKVLLSLFSNVAFGLGASYLSLYEERGTGLHWDDVDTSPLYDDSFNLLYVIYMLILDFIIYVILTWYIEAVFPGQYGIPKRWYFPFTISYWIGKPVRKIFVDQFGEYIEETDYTGESANTFEDEPTGLSKGVVISNLSKVYSNGKIAVDNISLNFYEGQITSFLGHNGAGKTTTISILTGLFPPTQGSAKIYGLDIRSEMDKIRNSLGMCPQHNVLFDRLTVEEHLYFYGHLRSGGSQAKSLITKEGEQMLLDLGLPHKRNALASDLSGGMQRKLSIAVAFIGGSKTVILDEPTSGVDPYSRRSIWELLLKYKRGRTVILTTHYMDEADLLSDRIAIIANGKLQCCGSSVFLKSIYGSGYHLTIEMRSYTDKLPPTTEFDGDGDISDMYHPHVVALNKHIKEFVGSAKLAGQIGSEVMFVLPPRDDFSAFTALCDSLDSNLAKLNILSYGISDTSLEEIFLKVAEQNDPAMRGNVSRGRVSYLNKLFRWLNKRKNNPSVNASAKSEPHNSKMEKEIVVHLNGANVKYTTVSISDTANRQSPKSNSPNAKWRQFMALHMKRFQHTRRNRKALFSELILPAIFVCMSLAVTSIFPTLQERPALNVEPWLYPQPRFMFYSNDAPGNERMESYLTNMKGPEGLGSLCILIDGKRSSQCVDVTDLKSYSDITESNLTIIECSCDTGAQICPAGIGDLQPPYSTIASGDTLYDMTGQNISSWIVNTWPRYAQHRYGGYSLGAKGIVPNIDVEEITQGVLKVVKDANPTSIFEIFDTITRDEKPSQNNIKVWFNNKGWVSSVAYMSAINNVLLRASLPANISNKYGIRTINHPMNFTEKQLEIELIKQAGISLLHAISVIFALSFVPASFTLYIIEERTSSSKHLQLVSGVSPWIYWVQAYTWDMVCYIVSALLCVFIFLMFNEEAYVSSTNLPGLLLLFLLYGWSCIPLMYPVSYLFSIPSSAFVGLACANMFIGIITTVTTFVLGTFDDEELRAVDDIIKEVFLVFPHFCLGDGLMKLATNHMASASLSSLDIEWSANILEWDFIGKNLLCMFVLGIVFFAVTIMTEYKLFSLLLHTTYKPKVEQLNGDEEEEEDVRAERIRIEEGRNLSDILIINKLTKVYRRRGLKKPSVNQICVGVKEGECFGLLGLNGAGKTSTFKMLTGAVKVTSGDAYVKGYSIRQEMNKVRSQVGYCPQFDALDPLLTPREHLQFYARVRNIPPAVLQKRVDESLEELGLGHYSDRLTGTLSGGNKRKLSTAIALIGNPPLIFLDEPTSGMDPKARRFLWSCIQDTVRRGCCVVLTTHSMEECQALCTRLTIMVNGKFTCIGTSQHLKNKFGGGYSIVIRCKEEHIPAVRQYLAEKLPLSKLMETHYNQLRYQIAGSRLSTVFAQLEDARKAGLLNDYSLSQTTLEEVFIRFANEQAEPETVGGHFWPSLTRCLVCSRRAH